MTDIMRVLSATSAPWILNEPCNRRWASADIILSKDEIEAIIFEHIEDVICAGNAETADLLDNFLFDLVHEPGTPTPYGLVFATSREGSGVSLYLRLLQEALTDQIAYYGAGLPKHVEATVKSKKVMIVDEDIFRRGSLPPVKAILTSQSHCRLITVTGSHEADMLKARYRRLKIFQVSPKRAGDVLYFNRLAQAIKQGGVEIYRDYLFSL